MDLLPDDLRSRLPPLHAQDSDMDPVVHARYFLPGTDLVWYPIEGQSDAADFVFFGFVLGLNGFRCFRLSQLEAARGPEGQTVKRDAALIPGRLTDVVPAPDL